MAVPTIVKGSYIDILAGDGAGPENFLPICGITTRNFTQQVNTNDVFVPDCADPEDIPTRRLVVTGRQWDISGDGLLNLDNWETHSGKLGVTANYRFVIGRPAGSTDGTGYFGGAAMITNMQIGGTTGGGQFATVSLAIASDGEWTYTPAP
jgi:hypothetical protein